VALFLIVSGWLVPLGFPHAGEDDRACARPFEATDTPGQLDGAVGNAPADHCLACHSARSFRSALSGEGWVALWLEPGSRVDDRQLQSTVHPSIDRIPARAPPAHLHTI
jgi:hypothetical protein